MCSRTIPTSYSTFPQFEKGFYSPPPYPPGTSYASLADARRAQPPVPPVKQFKAPVTETKDVWRDNSCDNQLDLQSLMPSTWRDCAQGVLEGKDNWSKFAVSKDGFHKYISGAGACRVFEMERSAYGKKYGIVNGIGMLRSQPLPCITLGEDAVIFNDSSDRQALASGRYRNVYGCGQ